MILRCSKTFLFFVEQETNHRNMISRKAHEEKLAQQEKEHVRLFI
jgi:hypothetical protein